MDDLLPATQRVRVYPDGRKEVIQLTPEQAAESLERDKQLLDFETGELKSTRALREKHGGSLVKRAADEQD